MCTLSWDTSLVSYSNGYYVLEQTNILVQTSSLIFCSFWFEWKTNKLLLRKSKRIKETTPKIADFSKAGKKSMFLTGLFFFPIASYKCVIHPGPERTP